MIVDQAMAPQQITDEDAFPPTRRFTGPVGPDPADRAAKGFHHD
jgi:hypothetical protein